MDNSYKSEMSAPQSVKMKQHKLQSALRNNLKRRKAQPKPGLHNNYRPRPES